MANSLMHFQVKFPRRLCNRHMWSKRLHVYSGTFVSDVLSLLDIFMPKNIMYTFVSNVLET